MEYTKQLVAALDAVHEAPSRVDAALTGILNQIAEAADKDHAARVVDAIQSIAEDLDLANVAEPPDWWLDLAADDPMAVFDEPVRDTQ